MEIVRWTFAGLGLLFFLGSVVTNTATIVAYVWKKKTGSLVPLLGGLAGGAAVLVAPVEWLHPYWWVPLVVDPGCAWLTVMGIVHGVRRLLGRS